MQDPYSTLGVSKTATQDEIKKAYRKLAKSYHPDNNAGDKEKEKKFKEVSHAFDQVGTAEARSKFEKGEEEQRMYQDYQQYQQGAGAQGYHPGSGGGGFQGFGDFDAEDIFSTIFGQARGKKARGPSAGDDDKYQLEVDFKEAALGGEKVITLPSGKKLQIKIPAGFEDGQKLRFKGQGGPGHNGGPAGDVLIEIHVKSQEGFTRAGNDIQTEVPISFFEALSGAEIQVPTLEGNVMLKIPAGVSTGSKLRIKGKGAGAGEKRGNQIVVLKVVTPKEVPEGLKEAIADLKQKYDYYPRAS